MVNLKALKLKYSSEYTQVKSVDNVDIATASELDNFLTASGLTYAVVDGKLEQKEIELDKQLVESFSLALFVALTFAGCGRCKHHSNKNRRVTVVDYVCRFNVVNKSNVVTTLLDNVAIFSPIAQFFDDRVILPKFGRVGSTTAFVKDDWLLITGSTTNDGIYKVVSSTEQAIILNSLGAPDTPLVENAESADKDFEDGYFRKKFSDIVGYISDDKQAILEGEIYPLKLQDIASDSPLVGTSRVDNKAIGFEKVLIEKVAPDKRLLELVYEMAIYEVSELESASSGGTTSSGLGTVSKEKVGNYSYEISSETSTTETTSSYKLSSFGSTINNYPKSIISKLLRYKSKVYLL